MLVNDIMRELIMKQRLNVNPEYYLEYDDLRRICKFITDSPFDTNNNCCIWKSFKYPNKDHSRNFITFYYKNRKTTLTRLFYINFIGDISHREYITYTCKHKGHCLNINHIIKKSYNIKNYKFFDTVRKGHVIQSKYDNKPLPKSGYVSNIIVSFN